MPWNEDGTRKNPSIYQQRDTGQLKVKYPGSTHVQSSFQQRVEPTSDNTGGDETYVPQDKPEAAGSPYAMKGHTQPGPFQRKSPLKQNPKGLIFDPTQSGKQTYLSQDIYTGMEGTSEEWKAAHPISSHLYHAGDKASGIYWGWGGHGATKKDMNMPIIPKFAQHVVGGAAEIVGMGVNVLENIAGNVARQLKLKSTKTGHVIGSEEHRKAMGYTK